MNYMFAVPGQPRGKGRPRFRKTGKFVQAYTPKETHEYENVIRTYYKGKKMHGMISLTIGAYYEIPKSYTKKYRKEIIDTNIRPMVKPDIDNVIKVVMDALNGVAYDDDKQIVTVLAVKQYSSDPRLEIILGELNDDIQNEPQ